MNSPVLPNNRAAPWLQRVAAYGFLMLAGWGVAALALSLEASREDVVEALRHPFSDGCWLSLFGLAAVLGASTVHRPFMRAVNAGCEHCTFGWAAVGVIASHVAIVALVFITVLAGYPHTHYQPHPSQQFFTDPETSWRVAWFIGVIALMLGFLPNMLIAEGFAIFMIVRAYRKRKASHYPTELQPTLKGANHDVAATAE